MLELARADAALMWVLLQSVNPKLLIWVQGTQGKNYPMQGKGNTDTCVGRWWGGKSHPPFSSPLCIISSAGSLPSTQINYCKILLLMDVSVVKALRPPIGWKFLRSPRDTVSTGMSCNGFCRQRHTVSTIVLQDPGAARWTCCNVF